MYFAQVKVLWKISLVKSLLSRIQQTNLKVNYEFTQKKKKNYNLNCVILHKYVGHFGGLRVFLVNLEV